MSKQSTHTSFVVRVYRIDTRDQRKINGLVEALDGSGEHESFADVDELGAILKRRAAAQRKGRAKGSSAE
ncbi:MAG: hypothetical protein JW821_03635 [Deltaproteobacteria bacterium]|nr:hypothetical protein [Deltaproteobacteria bacterium]